jgi:hypothetical protein
MSHRTCTRILAVLTASAILAITALGAAVESASAATPACQEDQPCWVWSKMGNRKRGIVTAWGDSRVVGPCGFRREYDRSRKVGMGRYFLRTNRIEGLRGDYWALRHGCIGNVQNW